MGDKKAIIEALCEQKYDKTNQDKIINILKDQAIAWEGVYKDDRISIPFILPFKFVDFFQEFESGFGFGIFCVSEYGIYCLASIFVF